MPIERTKSEKFGKNVTLLWNFSVCVRLGAVSARTHLNGVQEILYFLNDSE